MYLRWETSRLCMCTCISVCMLYVVCVFVDDCPLVLGSSRAAVPGISTIANIAITNIHTLYNYVRGAFVGLVMDWLHLHCSLVAALEYTRDVMCGREPNRLGPGRLPAKPLLPKKLWAHLYSLVCRISISSKSCSLFGD